MKNINSLVASLIFMGMLFLASCAKDDTSDPTNPQTTDKYSGNWYVSEDSKIFGKSTYNLVISEDPNNTSKRFISYLYGFKTKTTATINGSNISIAKQVIDGQNVSGSGVLANSTQINLTYYVQSTATKYDTVMATLTK